MTVSLPSKLEQSYLKAKFALFKADSEVYNGLPQFFLSVPLCYLFFESQFIMDTKLYFVSFKPFKKYLYAVNSSFIKYFIVLYNI